MGNNVFRFFLEWLKNEMHEEAYARLVKVAHRRDMAMRAQTRDVNMANPGWVYTQGVSENQESAVSYSVTDQMYKLANSFVSSLDGVWQSYGPSYGTGVDEALPGEGSPDGASEDTATESQEEMTKKKHRQLWELAQAEGDDAWLEWINSHIWTYIGLSAPLLGAINPLRAVLSGENMGLPMTDKSARKMEICEYQKPIMI